MSLGTFDGSTQIDRESDVIRRNEQLREALEWLAEMAGYAIYHLEDEWARKNRGDLQSAIDQANAALSACL